MAQKHQVAEARGANMSDFMMHLKGVQMNQIGNGCLTDNGMMSRYVRK